MKKKDIILIISIIIIAIISYFFFTLGKNEKGGQVIITVDGTVIEKFNLYEDREYTIKSGDHYNILTIKNGYADVTEADCPDKHCVNQKKINKNGEKIICLPNKTIVKIIGADESNIDSVAN